MMQRDLDQDVYIPLTLAQIHVRDAIIRLPAGIGRSAKRLS